MRNFYFFIDRVLGNPSVDGELARVQFFLVMALLSWGLHFFLWELGWIVAKVFSGFFLLGGYAASAQCLFHGVTAAIVRLPKGVQSIAQIGVALVVIVTPMAYLLPSDSNIDSQAILLQAFQPFFTSWAYWAIFGFYVYLVYIIFTDTLRERFLPVRRYLVLAAGVFVIVTVAAHGGFQSTDEDGYPLHSGERLDPDSLEGRRNTAASYLRLTSLGFTTILCADWNRRRRDKWKNALIKRSQ